MFSQGVARFPLFIAPYTIDPTVGHQLSPNAYDAIVFNGNDALVLKPFTYGVNIKASGSFTFTQFDATYLYEYQDLSEPLGPRKYRFQMAPTYYKGGEIGETLTYNLAPQQTNIISDVVGIPNGFGGSEFYGLGILPTSWDALFPSGLRERLNLTIDGVSASGMGAWIGSDGTQRINPSRTQPFLGAQNGIIFDNTKTAVPEPIMIGSFVTQADFLAEGGMLSNQTGTLFPNPITSGGGGSLGYPTFWSWDNIQYVSSYSLPPQDPPEVMIEDDDELQAAFLNALGTFQNGFFFTGLLDIQRFPNQPKTPIIFDPQNDRYWLVQWLPATAEAQEAVTNPTSALSIKYSPEGYMVAMSRNLSDLYGVVFHTQSLSFEFPQLTIPPAPTFNIPCFNPCVPNLLSN